MTDTPTAGPLIDYAVDQPEMPADRLLRRIVAWTAIVTGGESLLSTALVIALSRKWLATPPNMSWDLGSQWDQLVTAGGGLAMCGLVIGGVLLLRRWRAGALVVRTAAASSIVLTVVGLAFNLRLNPAYASYWSTPGSFVEYSLQYFRALFVDFLLVLLTLPPLARRM